MSRTFFAPSERRHVLRWHAGKPIQGCSGIMPSAPRIHSMAQDCSGVTCFEQFLHSAHAGSTPVLSASGHSTTSGTMQLHATFAVEQQYLHCFWPLGTSLVRFCPAQLTATVASVSATMIPLKAIFIISSELSRTAKRVKFVASLTVGNRRQREFFQMAALEVGQGTLYGQSLHP